MAEPLQLHPELWPAIDGPADSDQRWFMDHPAALVRLRPQFPDELEALDAVAQVAGPDPLVTIEGWSGSADLPADWMAVVDVFRLRGAPPGPNGESGRLRLACPSPVDAAMAEAIARLAVEIADRNFPYRYRKRSAAKGFG